MFGLRSKGVNNMQTENQPIHPETHIGHIHLKVSDLERSVVFYRDALGFELMQRMGNSAAFLSAGGYHHHIGLNTWESKGAPPSPSLTAVSYNSPSFSPNASNLAAPSNAPWIPACAFDVWMDL